MNTSKKATTSEELVAVPKLAEADVGVIAGQLVEQAAGTQSPGVAWGRNRVRFLSIRTGVTSRDGEVQHPAGELTVTFDDPVDINSFRCTLVKYA